MNKSKYLSLLGAIFAVGLIIGLVLINSNNNDTTDDNESSIERPDAVEVGGEAIEVVSADDGSINANNLFIPWTINKNGGKFYLSQREGTVIEIDGDLGIVEVQSVEVTEDILHEGEGGFLGFTLAPDFETSKMAIAYHTYEKDGDTLNRIVSLTLEGDKWVETDVLVDNIPGGEINNGGRVQIGPDGMIYATTGDTGDGQLAQDLESLAGKILRLELDGDVPVDNPFEDSYVFSYGHRNSQGLAWDNNGNLYSSEHGESGHDEINLIEAGANYGWPVIEGDEEAPEMETPILHSGEKTWAPAGMAFNNGQLYIASLAGKKLFTFDIATEVMSDYYDEAGRLRDVLIDGNELFMITSNHDERGEPADKDDRLIQISLTEQVNAN